MWSGSTAQPRPRVTIDCNTVGLALSNVVNGSAPRERSAPSINTRVVEPSGGITHGPQRCGSARSSALTPPGATTTIGSSAIVVVVTVLSDGPPRPPVRKAMLSPTTTARSSSPRWTARVSGTDVSTVTWRASPASSRTAARAGRHVATAAESINPSR